MSRSSPSTTAYLTPWVPAILLAIALIPLGARSPLAFNLTLLAIVAVWLVSLIAAAASRGAVKAADDLLEGNYLSALLVLPALVTAQAVAQIFFGFSDGPSRAITQSALALGGFVVFYLIVRSVARERRHFRTLIASLVIIGALEAAYGVLNLLAGNERLLIYERWAYLNSATGTLISRNHFSFLMELTLPVAVAFAAVVATGDGPTPAPESELKAKRVLVGSAVTAMALALIFSRSRMGVMSLSLATLTVVVLNRLLMPARRGRKRPLRRMAAPAALGIIVVGFALMIGVDPVLERFFNISRDLEDGRWPIWRATWAMIAERPLFGHGWGTFEGLLPGYRPRPTGYFYDHAHNEYLEVLAESGIVGLCAVGWLIFLFGRRLVSTLSAPLTRTQRTTVMALAVSIMSVLIHSAADFGLRVPGVALTFLFIVALFARAAEEPELIDGRRQKESES